MPPLRSKGGTPRIEAPRADEIPEPLPAVLPEPTGPVARRQDGTVADKDAARELGRLGGLAKARGRQFASTFGLMRVDENGDFAPYMHLAGDFVRAHTATLAGIAGGQLGPGPNSMIASAGLQLAASRFAFDRGAASGDFSVMQLGSKLANDSRQNLLAAYELAVREGQARGKNPAPVDFAKIFAAPHKEEPSK